LKTSLGWKNVFQRKNSMKAKKKTVTLGAHRFKPHQNSWLKYNWLRTGMLGLNPQSGQNL